MERYGAIIVFRPGISKKEAIEVLKEIQEDLDSPKSAEQLLETYDDKFGHPVFYIP